ISVNTTYYVDKAATGANDGSSWEDAFTTLYSALSAADVDRIYIAKGYYYRNQSWQAYNPARSIEVIGDLNQGSGDGVYLTSDCHNNLGAWALDGNHYEATDGGRTVRHVWDKNNPDANGNAQPLTLRASEAEVDANANSWYQDATHVYVRLADGREPDSDVYFYESGTACRMARDNQTLYIENLNIQGGWYNTSIGNATSAGGAKFYAKNCLFKYGRRPGVGTYDLVRLLGLDESILWNCTVAVSEESDGIHYASQNGITPTAI
ncbi:MAG: hypothetical protein GWN14_02435, partial [candidate division Zixibacteria bacterium]|nr:hypothetical protein [candidate division Zixibacteria bacterium]NIX54804.1 hypothetical protein [candidate division Zixibacteria bacterium]